MSHILQRFDLGASSTMLDIGAGTGKLTSAFADRVGKVVAVEPIAAMRDVFKRSLPHVGLIGGAAERLPLRAESFEAVVVAQAFHWFDAEPAIGEIARVLVEGGGLALVWNARARVADWAQEVWEPVRILQRAIPTMIDSWRHVDALSRRFGPVDEVSFPHLQSMTKDGLVARIASVSVVGALEDERKKQLLDGVRKILATHPQTKDRETIEVEYDTRIFCFDRKS
ncbi:MAG: class I SAM-dependent methyltransferase [Actinomycetota bacterium]|nr:class I SAM-dependent methyltransferase [Actinomycetota bacterium]